MSPSAGSLIQTTSVLLKRPAKDSLIAEITHTWKRVGKQVADHMIRKRLPPVPTVTINPPSPSSATSTSFSTPLHYLLSVLACTCGLQCTCCSHHAATSASGALLTAAPTNQTLSRQIPGSAHRSALHRNSPPAAPLPAQ